MRNYGLAGMLDKYMLGSWATGNYSRRLVRSRHVFAGNHKSERFPQAFKAVWLKIGNERVNDKELILAFLPNGLILYQRQRIWHALGRRSANVFADWVQETSEGIGRTFLLDGVHFDVRRLTLPEYNLVTNNRDNAMSGTLFSEHLVRHLATLEG